MKLPRNFTYSTSEYVIEYTTGNGKGTMVIDCNLYDKISKIVQRKLKGCTITSWIQRRKLNEN